MSIDKSGVVPWIVLGLFMSLVSGLKGNQWWAIELTSSGWNHLTVDAASPYDAIQKAKAIAVEDPPENC